MAPWPTSAPLGLLGHRAATEPRCDGDGHPRLVVFSTCVDFIRTVPFLQHDPDRPEDVMTDSEDHCGDEARYACMSLPWVPMKEAPKPENISGYRPYRTDVQPGDWRTY